MRVVLVDDVPEVRHLLRHLLVDAGCEVVGEAGDGEQAVHLARTLAPDVVVIDIEMPMVDGVDATRRIAAHPEAPAVVAFTGRPDRQDDALAAGAHACFDKVDVIALVDHVAALCAESHT
jgi:DNA-binding NarL/FixJ family response regulator